MTAAAKDAFKTVNAPVVLESAQPTFFGKKVIFTSTVSADVTRSRLALPLVGVNVGPAVGAKLGNPEGAGVGARRLYVGASVGDTVGASLGEAVGD